MTEPKPTYRARRLDCLSFVVLGTPRPKQSFRMGRNRGYQPKRITDWQNQVSLEARKAMGQRKPWTSDDLSVTIDFYLPDRRRRDLDNLSKAVLDACNGIVWEDDQQITRLVLCKFFRSGELGVTVYIEQDEDETE